MSKGTPSSEDGDGDGGAGVLYYGLKVHTNRSHVTVMLYYTAAGANRTQVARATAEKFVEDNVWLHVLVIVDDGVRFTGLLQDVRVYPGAALDRGQVRELHGQPAKADLRAVSGYLRYRQDERTKSFVVEVRDDSEEEGEEVFYLQLVAARGGARLPWPRPTAVLRSTGGSGSKGSVSGGAAAVTAGRAAADAVMAAGGRDRSDISL
ncbi:hypothetical protein CRUP_038332 [Coryphaenoides rupestris]|nr:hypothetical protein CRUP_038332 [Coryphaenoides rupestris]